MNERSGMNPAIGMDATPKKPYPPEGNPAEGSQLDAVLTERELLRREIRSLHQRHEDLTATADKLLALLSERRQNES